MRKNQEFFRTLLEKIAHIKTTLEDVTDRIFQGLKTGADKIYILEEKKRSGKAIQAFSRHTGNEYKLEPDLVHPLMKGGDSKRYSLNRDTGLVILFPYAKQADGKVGLIPESEMKENFPATYEYLKECKTYLENREDGKMKGKNWFAFSRSQALDVMPQAKIFTPDIAPIASYTIDDTGDMFFTGGAAGGYGILAKKHINPLYLLGLLNSSLLDFCNKQVATQMRGGWYSFEARFIKSLPIYVPNKTDAEKYAIFEKIPEIVQQIIDFRKAGKTGDAEFLEKKIDGMVEQIYGVRL